MSNTADRMGIGHGGDSAFQQSIYDLQAELREVAGNSSFVSRTAIVAHGILEALNLPPMADSLGVLHEADRQRTGSERHRLIRTAAGVMLQRRPGLKYPDDYTDDATVVDGFRWIFDDPGRTQEFNGLLANGKLHTSVPQRYVSELIAAMALGHRAYGDRPTRTRLDVGCSLNYGNIQVLTRGENPFQDVQVVVKPKGGDKLEVDQSKSDVLNRYLRDSGLLVANKIVGIDNVDVSKTVKPEWIRMLLTPDELLQGDMVALYDRLQGAKLAPGQLSFLLADISDKKDMDKIRETVDCGEFDVVSDVAALYQVSSAQLKRSRNNIHDLLREDGFAYFCDFLIPARDRGGTYLGRMGQWARMNLILYDKFERQLHLIASFTTGRAKAIRFHPNFGRLAQGGPFEDVAAELSS